MIIYLYGLPAVGKNYIGKLISENIIIILRMEMTIYLQI